MGITRHLLLEVADGEIIGVREEMMDVASNHVRLKVVHHVSSVPLWSPQLIGSYWFSWLTALLTNSIAVVRLKGYVDEL